MDKPNTTTIASFKIEYLQFLNEQHEPTQNFPDFAQDPKTLLYLYREMALIRALDNKAVNLQRTGQMGTYPSCLGQEAIQAGIGHALHPDDVLCPFYRSQGSLQKGVKLKNVLSYWGGDERGTCYETARENFPPAVPIATQCLHAAGVAYAIKYRKQKRAAITTIGDGGTSKGDFYEAMNLAGVWHLPLVFVVNNNQWAISVPLKAQTAAETLAQKAIAAGFEGLQVDGNDVIAVRYAVSEALKKARHGDGPTLIEAVTYRLCDHTTADDATRYIPEEERKEAWKKEPIARLGFYLESKGLWSREKEIELKKEIDAEIDAVVKEYLSETPQKPTDIIDYLYAKLPDAYLDQRDALAGES